MHIVPISTVGDSQIQSITNVSGLIVILIIILLIFYYPWYLESLKNPILKTAGMVTCPDHTQNSLAEELS